MNAQDIAVQSYLTTQNIVFEAKLVGPTKREDWACDEWRVSFASRAASGGLIAKIEQEYYTGTGHRQAIKGAPKCTASPRSLAFEEWQNRYVRPVTPTAAGVLYSLLLDAQSADQNFLDWCSDLGYDSDSRKALKIYDACCEIRAKMCEVFTTDQRQTLATMLEDY